MSNDKWIQEIGAKSATKTEIGAIAQENLLGRKKE